MNLNFDIIQKYLVGLTIAATGLITVGCSLPVSKVTVETEIVDTSAVKADTDRALDYFLAGTVAAESGDANEAANQFHLAWLFDPMSTTIPLALAKAYTTMGEHLAALKVLDAAHQRNPKDLEILQSLVGSSIRAGNAQRALDALLEIRKQRPLTERELLQSAALFDRIGLPEEAIKMLEEYQEKYEPIPQIWEEIGKLHLKKRDIPAAQTAFEKLVAIDSTNHRVLFVLGGFAVAREDWPTAQAYFTQAVQQDSSEIRYWINLLLSLNQQAKYADVLTTTTAAAERFPDSALIYEIRGGAFERLKRWEDALEAHDRAISLDSSRYLPFMAKGFIYHQLKQWDKAEDAYAEALARSPNNPTVLNNFAYMLSEKNVRLKDGLDMVSQALEAEPDNGSFMDTRAWLLYRLGRYEESLAWALRAVKAGPPNGELYEHLARIYEALGQNAKAKKAWRKAAGIEPENYEYQKLAR